MLAPARKILLVSKDQFLAESLKGIFARSNSVVFEQYVANAVSAVQSPRLAEAALLVMDIDATNREELVALQGIMTRFPGTLPVVVLTEAFDDAVGRWFLQIRVSDFLRKPVSGEDIAQVCANVLGAASESPTNPAKIFSFISAAGGVGNTTLAVETAIQFAKREGEGKLATCLVDLDFQNDACASHLDIEPRLDMQEIGPAGERLDAQLLEVMGSKHDSGLVLFSAICNRGEAANVSPDVVLRLLDVISLRFDMVVLDLPRTWQPWTEDILEASDRVYVVTDMTVPGLRSARRTVQRINGKLNPESKPMVIVNRAEKQSYFGHGLRKADVERVLADSLAGLVSNNYGLVREAIDRGVPLETVKEGNAVSADLKRIVFA